MTLQETSGAEQCVTTCGQRAWRLACGLVWNTEDALDVVQAACLVVTTKADAIPSGDPWPWFARIVTLEGLKLREKRAKADRMGKNLARESAVITVDAGLLAERAEMQEQLRAMLRELPVEIRDALTLTQIAELSVREAAESLGVSASTVDRRVHEGLEILRRKLEPEGSRARGAFTLAALAGLKFEPMPADAMERWVCAVRTPELAITGVTPMKIAIIAALGFVVLAGMCAGCFWHFHHDQAAAHLDEFHQFMRGLHGK